MQVRVIWILLHISVSLLQLCQCTIQDRQTSRQPQHHDQVQIRTAETKSDPNPNTKLNPKPNQTNPNSTDPSKPYHLTVYGVGW